MLDILKRAASKVASRATLEHSQQPAQVLEHWHAEGHKALLFCQTQQMLDILERAVAVLGMRYHRMDGSTPVAR